MKKWTALLGLATLCFAPGVGAQTLLSNASLAGSVTASSTSIDYRYTRHTRGGGSGRGGGGGHVTVYYTWDPHTDQQINTSPALILNGSSGTATAAGTFYAPTYSASASGTTSLSSASNSAVFTTTYKAGTTLQTPQIAHQKVTAAVTTSSTFYFTLTDFADVTITATGSASGALALYGTLDEGVGVILALSGAGTSATSASLSPGNYWITSSTSGSAIQDTQLSTFLNLGTTDASYAFTVKFTQNAGGN